MSTKTKIQQSIEQGKPGEFYFAEDFIDITNNEQVRLALSRLSREKILLRVAQGIYYYPKIDPAIGKVSPGLEEIAYAIARRDRIKILPTGAYALNKLGLSTQLPMKVAFLTDGQSRKIKVGKRTLEFINKSPRKMAYEGKISGPVLIAIEELGSKSLTDELVEDIVKMLQSEDSNKMLHDMKLAPRWISEKFLPIVNAQ